MTTVSASDCRLGNGRWEWQPTQFKYPKSIQHRRFCCLFPRAIIDAEALERCSEHTDLYGHNEVVDDRISVDLFGHLYHKALRYRPDPKDAGLLGNGRV